MAPIRGNKKSARAQPDDSQSESEDQNMSDGNEALEKAKKILENAHRRRVSARTRLDSQVNARIESSQTAITTFFEERKEKVTKAQKTQNDRLVSLLETRRAILVRIFAAQKTIKDATLTMAKELEAVYGGRIEDIHDLKLTDKVSA